MDPEPLLQSLERLRRVRRRPVALSSETLVRSEPFDEPGHVLLVQPVMPIDLAIWARDQQDWVEQQLARHGGLLFRGFQIATAAVLDRVTMAIAGEPLVYRERSSPRHQVSGNVYTSTEHPADQTIFLHNENSYQHTWPRRVLFACATPPQTGGRTPIADTRRVFQRIDPAIRQRFIERGVMYVRNFGEGLGLSWQVVFQTEDRSAVDAYCRTAGIEVQWRDANRLRTRQVRPAVVRHPRTGEMSWFNHAVFFHLSTLEPSIREALLSQFSEEDVPNNSYYGDGRPIEPSVLDELRVAYAEATRTFSWQTGDLLLLDNLLMAHGREPFTGPRSILVSLALPARWTDFN
jgi:alpha-ketoglutarate-dependent taurine dioxygenase